jgi:hypothetical protein
MGPDGDAEHVAPDPAVEPLDHAVRVGRVGPGGAVLRAERGAGLGKGGGEAAAVVGQHVGEAEREGGRGLPQKRDGAPLRLVVPDGEMDGTGAAIDGDVEVTLAPLAVPRRRLA